MLELIFSYLELFEDYLWGYLAVPLLLIVGSYLTYHSNFFQIRRFPATMKHFFSLMRQNSTSENHRGIHPLKAFFASVGGCVGVGNIVGICTAIQIGGPGALLWIWITALVGTMIKYAEVYLGMRYRIPNDKGGFNGGPIYFLPKALNLPWIGAVVAILLCIYGVEVYQFSIVTDSIAENTGINRYLIIAAFLGIVLYASQGGVGRVGAVSSAVIPVFVVIYLGMGAWALFDNITLIPSVLMTVFKEAFTGSAAIGGFAGSTLMLAMSQGVRRGCYTGDLGVGYASVIHSESQDTVPQQQASLAFIDIFLDTFLICTTSILLILVSGLWNAPIGAELMVQTALSNYFPYMNFFMPFFLFLLGYSTINAYFCVGIKCAEYLSPKHGKRFYTLYSVIAFLLFSFIGTTQAQTIMTISGGLLLVFNTWGIYKLRHELAYDTPEVVTIS